MIPRNLSSLLKDKSMSIQNKKEKVINSIIDFYAELPNEPFIPGETAIPVTTKTIGSEDLVAISESIMDMHFTSGRFSKVFEEEIAKKMGARHNALLVNSGSSANLLAVSSLCQKDVMEEFGLPYLKPGDEVITAAAGFPTTVSPIVQNNLIPRFVDIKLDNLNVDKEDIIQAINHKTKAIVLAHTLGNPFRADILREICNHHNLYLIEDSCDAFGGSIFNGQEWKPVGYYGDFSTLSFYPAHHITTGEGGAVITSNGKLRRIAESIRDWGRHCWCETGCDNTCKKRFEWDFEGLPQGYDHKYVYSSLGYNLKMTDFQAALGQSQIKKLDNFVAIRLKNWNLLNVGIQQSPLLSKYFATVSETENTKPSWFGFGLRCINGIKRKNVINFLESKKIATRLLFGGNLTKQPAFKNIVYEISGSLANTDVIMNDFFWVGVHPKINEIHINFILNSLEDSIKYSL